jgi:hypothetical protein
MFLSHLAWDHFVLLFYNFDSDDPLQFSTHPHLLRPHAQVPQVDVGHPHRAAVSQKSKANQAVP